MRKDEVLDRIMRSTGLNLTQCTTLYNITICLITLVLKNEGVVDISDFGIFTTMPSKEAGVEVNRRVPVFTPSNQFKNRINRRVEPLKAINKNIREASATFDGNLNTQSKLGALGYSVQMSRDERWKILVQTAIPKYGIDSVTDHLSWLIRLKKKDTHRDYRSAIFEWEYDLKKLNKYRYDR